MQLTNQVKQIIILSLLGANLLLPVIFMKILFLDGNKAIHKAKENYRVIQENTSGFAKLINEPKVIQDYIQQVSFLHQDLKSSMPVKVEMIDSQKSLAALAKESDVNIISFRPVSNDVKFMKPGEKDKQVEVEGFLYSLMEVKLSGQYLNLINYLKRLEMDNNQTVLVDKLSLYRRVVSGENSMKENLLEMSLNLKIVYSTT